MVKIDKSVARRMEAFMLGNTVITVEIHWLKHLWNHEYIFETGVVRANEY